MSGGLILHYLVQIITNVYLGSSVTEPPLLSKQKREQTTWTAKYVTERSCGGNCLEKRFNSLAAGPCCIWFWTNTHCTPILNATIMNKLKKTGNTTVSKAVVAGFKTHALKNTGWKELLAGFSSQSLAWAQVFWAPCTLKPSLYLSKSKFICRRIERRVFCL